jgi:SAM-dependent methyltransferase
MKSDPTTMAEGDEGHPSADAIVDLYERHARAWTCIRAASNFVERPWIQRFAALLPSGGTVLDIGCGTGEPIGRFLADSGFAVTGVDASAPLIETARVALPAQAWFVGDMRALELGRRFDGLIAWHSFFHLPREDQRSMFGVFERHANPSSVLMFTSGPRAGVVLGDFEGEPLHHASLDPEEYVELLEAHGFSVIEHVSEDPDTQGATVWLAKRRP